MKKSLFIVIPHWHGEAYLPACLDSIALSELGDDISLQVLIVHNGGSDPLIPVSIQNCTTVVNTAPDLGFSRAVNIGLDYALRHSAEYIVLLNQDTRLSKGCLQALLNNTHAIPALYTPLVMTYDFGSVPSLYTSKYHPYADLSSDESTYELEMMSAVCIFGKAESFAQGGFFDTIFHMYYEDDDYSRRFRQGGGKIFLVKAATVAHFGRSTEAIGGGSPGQRRKEALKYLLRHETYSTFLKKLIYDYGSSMARLQLQRLLTFVMSDVRLISMHGYLKSASHEMINTHARVSLSKDLPKGS